MKCRPFHHGALTPGQLVLLDTCSKTPCRYALRFIEHVCHTFVHLAPVDLFLDAEQVTDTIPLSEVHTRLSIPEFECGDPIFLHGRPGWIAHTHINDLHVYVTLEGENTHKPVYTNLIHVDVTPTLSKYV
jgi:hypothetical protein